VLNAGRDKRWPPIKTKQSSVLSGARVPCPSFKTSYRCGGGMTAADAAFKSGIGAGFSSFQKPMVDWFIFVKISGIPYCRKFEYRHSL
jgi:hypothetical protein